MRRKAASLVILAVAVLLAAAAAPGTTVAGPTLQEEVGASILVHQQDPGQALFRGKGNCFTCHKQDATGTPLAPDLNDDEWLNFEDGRPSQEALEALIREGVQRPVRHPAPMPPMGGARLNDQEITELAEYVLSLTAE